jgi:cytochrome c553
MKRILVRLALLTTLASHAATPETDFSYCVTCHGSQGNGNPAIRAPKIAGMEPWYVRKQLERFRSGMRGLAADDLTGQEMRPVAMALRDSQMIEGAVSYAARFEPKSPPITVNGDAERGRMHYKTCTVCHGARGEGNPSLHAPALINQSDWYLVTQLERFRTGLRGFAAEDAEGAQMRAVAASLPDANAISDVVAFINTLR